MIDNDENLFKKITSWLKRNGINYKIEEGSIDTTVKVMSGANGSVELIFNPLMTRPRALPRCAMPTHAAQGKMFYIKIGDWGKWINEFIKWAKDNGYYECNYYRCAQWGTWKFNQFTSMQNLNKFLKKIFNLSGLITEGVEMKLEEAHKVLKENGYELEDYID